MNKTNWSTNNDYFTGYDIFQSNSDRYNAALSWCFEELKSSRTVLDAGAGTGILTKKLLENNTNVTAVDINREALERLKSKCEKFAGLFSVESGEIGGSNLKIAASKFDSTVAMLILPFPENIERFLSTIYDSLKENGKFVIVAWACREDIYNGIIEQTEEELYTKNILPGYNDVWRIIADSGQELAKVVIEKQLTESRLMALLSKIGFRKIRMHDSTYNGFTYNVTCVR